MIWIWQFKAIRDAMIRPNTKFFHDGLLIPFVRIFCSPRLRTLANVEKCGSNMAMLSYSSHHNTAQYQDMFLKTSGALL